MRILSISPAHDSSVCLYEDGKIISFYKEERITRIKRDRFPLRSIELCAKSTQSKDIDAFVLSSVEESDSFVRYCNIVKKYFNFSHAFDLSSNHHLQHASLAFYNSGFEEAATIVIDRNGSIVEGCARESETIFNCSYPDNFIPVYKNFWIYHDSAHKKIRDHYLDQDIEIDCNSMYGIVKVYETATSLIRQDRLENGKTMGLSAYGNKKNNFPDLFFNKTNIPIDAIFSHDDYGKGYSATNKFLDGFATNEITVDNYQLYADYAMHVQLQTHEAVAHLVEKTLKKINTKNIVITGGYGLNVVCNGFLIKNFPGINFYFEPIADDTGNSIGGAMLYYRMMTKDTNIYPKSDTFIHGINHDLSNIVGTKVSAKDVANILINGKSVAIYEGLAEGGPRALGHRSILYYPENPNSKEIVNKIKKREWYRPFAGAVLEEDAEKYFDMLSIKSSPYMTISFSAKKLTRDLFPGIVHVDGSCRVQTVNKDNPTLYNLLNQIKKITGHGILLNTSFNLAGEPLVETPEDAIKTLNGSALDYLWFPEIGKIVE